MYDPKNAVLNERFEQMLVHFLEGFAPIELHRDDTNPWVGKTVAVRQTDEGYVRVTMLHYYSWEGMYVTTLARTERSPGDGRVHTVVWITDKYSEPRTDLMAIDNLLEK